MKTLLASTPAALIFALVAACGPATQGPVEPDTAQTTTATPTATPTSPGDPNDPFAVDGLLREEALPMLKGPQPSFNEAVLDNSVKGVPAAPPNCDAFVKRTTKNKPTCTDKAGVLDVIDQAMSSSDEAVRDEMLLSAESCTGVEPGLVRALRIELAPAPCGDVMAEPVLKAKPAGMSGAVQHTLVGQAIAARLTRTVGKPPTLTAPFTQKKVLDFTKQTLWPWYKEQLVAVKALSLQGRELAFYGKGLVALASGWANLRLVEVVREAPIPDEYRKDPDIGNVYYGKLDIELEPTKDDGRDGALVGLGTMAQAGVLVDARVTATRSLLAKMYGGRRVDALDILSFAHIPDPTANTLDNRLAAKLPAFFTGLLLDPKNASDPNMLRSLLHRGIPIPFRAALKEAEGSMNDQAKALYARGRLELGVRYWRAVDIDSAVALYTKIPKAGMSTNAKLELGVALALRNGPEDVAGLMRKNEAFNPKFGDVRALDWFAKDTSERPTAGLAMFNAACIRQIAVPRDADAAYWEKLEERYRAASTLLADPAAKHEADERAKAAAAYAKAIKAAAPK